MPRQVRARKTACNKVLLSLLCNKKESFLFSLCKEWETPLVQRYIRKYCGAGSKMFTYYLDGKRYPCQFFTPMSIGIERAKQFEGKAFEEGIIIDLLDQKCQDCPAVSICPTCIGTNMASFGNLYAKDDGYCRLLKYQFVATSYFKWEQIKRGVLEVNNEQKWRLLKAIYRIQSEMRIE